MPAFKRSSCRLSVFQVGLHSCYSLCRSMDKHLSMLLKKLLSHHSCLLHFLIGFFIGMFASFRDIASCLLYGAQLCNSIVSVLLEADEPYVKRLNYWLSCTHMEHSSFYFCLDKGQNSLVQSKVSSLERNWVDM